MSLVIITFSPYFVFFCPLISILSESVFPTIGIHPYRNLYSIYSQITLEEPMLEVTFSVETFGHYSKEKGGKKTQVITFCLWQF